MKKEARLVAGLTALVVLSMAPGAAAAEAGIDSVDQLVAQAQKVSIVPVDEASLRALFSSVDDTEALELIETRLVATTDVTFAATPIDAAARATVAATGAPSAVSPQATGCWTAKAARQATAAAGNVLYTYFTTGGWCSSGSTVTSARFVEAGGETSTPGWRYEGVIKTGSGVYSNQGRTYSQHQFVLGVGGWDIQSPTPCARVNGTSAGTYTNTSTCSIS